jgi:hypothetical protein
MKRFRTLLVGTALSLSLLGGATGALAAPPDGSFGHHVSTMAREHTGIGPHIQECHPNETVGAHLQDMRKGTHNHEMTCDM